jgi:hypothetical protein
VLNEAGLATITNSDYKIVVDFEKTTVISMNGEGFLFDGNGMSIEESQGKSAAVVAFGYGKAFDSIYVGAEYVQRISSNFEDNHKDVNIGGFTPTAAVRVGYIYDGWLLYAKLGAAYNERIRICGKNFSGIDVLYGAGLEKAIGTRWTVRLDFDVVNGKDYNVKRSKFGLANRYGLTYTTVDPGITIPKGIAATNPNGINGMQFEHVMNPVELENAYGLPEGYPVAGESLKIKRKSNFNVRLMFSYSL